MSTTAPPQSPFGERLRRWRHARRLSQLELANLAASTARHISFVETGRSRPSRSMVLRLAEALDVPLEERNQLLILAGLAPVHARTPLASAGLAPFRAAIDRLLAAHEPYPALVVDPYTEVVAANRPCGVLFGSDLVGSNLIERYLAPEARAAIANWPEVAWSAVCRLRRQLDHDPFDERLRDLVTMAERAAVDGRPEPTGQEALVVCPWFRFDDQVVRTAVLAARFDTAVDVTLDGLRIELIYPLDEPAEQFFRDRAPRAPGG